MGGEDQMPEDKRAEEELRVIEMKKEPIEHMEEDNEDSGVSPSHYMTSSSSSSIFSRLSPQSHYNPDSRPSSGNSSMGLLCEPAIEYKHPLPGTSSLAPMSVHQQIPSHAMFPDLEARNGQPEMIDSEEIDAHQRSEETEQQPDMVLISKSKGKLKNKAKGKSLVKRLSKDHCSDVSHPIACPLCPGLPAMQNKIVITQHLMTHVTETRAESASSIYACILQKLHNIDKKKTRKGASEDEFGQDSSIDVYTPKFKAKGEIKTEACSKCPNKYISKAELWKHQDCHFSADKLNRCPYCPFVSPLNHHYDYHINKHLQNKAYKCELCDYSCINKSMLSSHMKSHSNFYQYVCCECGFKTKYFNMMKGHYQEKKHEPILVVEENGMVFNFDFSQNKRLPRKAEKRAGSGSNKRAADKPRPLEPVPASPPPPPPPPQPQPIESSSPPPPPPNWPPGLPISAGPMADFMKSISFMNNMSLFHYPAATLKQMVMSSRLAASMSEHSLDEEARMESSLSDAQSENEAYDEPERLPMPRAPICSSSSSSSSSSSPAGNGKHYSQIDESDGTDDDDDDNNTDENNNNNNNNDSVRNDDHDSLASPRGGNNSNFNVAFAGPTQDQPLDLSSSTQCAPAFVESRCRFCRSCYSSAEMLGLHMSTHDLEDPLKCTMCELRFDNYVEYADHIALRGVFHRKE